MTKKSNLKAKFTLFCDYALISQDNKLSIIGEFDHIYSTNEKAVLGKGFLVSRLVGTPHSKLDLKLSINNVEKNDELFKKEFQLESDHVGRAGLIVEFGGLVFNKFGIYKATISSSGSIISEVDLNVVKVKPPVVVIRFRLGEHRRRVIRLVITNAPMHSLCNAAIRNND